MSVPRYLWHETGLGGNLDHMKVTSGYGSTLQSTNDDFLSINRSLVNTTSTTRKSDPNIIFATRR